VSFSSPFPFSFLILLFFVSISMCVRVVCVCVNAARVHDAMSRMCVWVHVQDVYVFARGVCDVCVCVGGAGVCVMCVMCVCILCECMRCVCEGVCVCVMCVCMMCVCVLMRAMCVCVLMRVCEVKNKINSVNTKDEQAASLLCSPPLSFSFSPPLLPSSSCFLPLPPTAAPLRFPFMEDELGEAWL